MHVEMGVSKIVKLLSLQTHAQILPIKISCYLIQKHYCFNSWHCLLGNHYCLSATACSKSPQCFMTFRGDFEQLFEVTMASIENKMALNQQLISNLESKQLFTLSIAS